jgi:glycosyltransferase involved in cell wall biosynthesis
MSSRFDISCGFKIAKIVRQNNYKIIHSHTPRAAMVARIASFLAGIPMVHHVHSPTARDTESNLRNSINSIIEKVSLTGVKYLIPVSMSLSAYLQQLGYSYRRIKPVFNGVPTPGPLPKRKKPDNMLVLGTIALFRPRKGIEILLEAMAQLRKQDISIRLIAVGPFETSDYQASIHALCDKLAINELIEWTGFCKNVNKELSHMDVFILPSIFGEGMPMVILESMAMGVPVIASDVEGIPEVIKSGVTGIIVSPNNPTALAKAIADLYNNKYDWELIRNKAYELQTSEFSDNSMASGVAKIYEIVLNK